MGIASTLALAIIPLVKRSSSPTETLEIENARLRAEIKEMTANRDELREQIRDWRRRLDQGYAVRQQIAQAQYQQAAQQIAMQNFYSENQLGQQARQWPYCDCMPPHGRAGFLRGDN